MNVKDCYDALGADYESVLRRLSQEDRVKRFLLKFAQDQSFAALCRALEEENFQEAFRMAHSLKGVCMNLGLTPLLSSSQALTDDLRGCAPTAKTGSLFAQVRLDYEKTIAAIRSLSAG